MSDNTLMRVLFAVLAVNIVIGDTLRRATDRRHDSELRALRLAVQQYEGLPNGTVR